MIFCHSDTYPASLDRVLRVCDALFLFCHHIILPGEDKTLPVNVDDDKLHEDHICLDWLVVCDAFKVWPHFLLVFVLPHLIIHVHELLDQV